MTKTLFSPEGRSIWRLVVNRRSLQCQVTFVGVQPPFNPVAVPNVTGRNNSFLFELGKLLPPSLLSPLPSLLFGLYSLPPISL